MTTVLKPSVQLIAWTNFQAATEVPWDTDTEGGQLHKEFAD
ncbi:hypothetical protein ACFQZ4_17720 [Catellatospora coxensis]|uniref:Uncharacterized protein n=1 Tax=Catellatospora coxensis TaxID=310354 RepID=A0A8J3P726_9ACTN|nr:hypothetical protein [Catellatospora coxensis]GIG06152.1 hypothetical protein Cco03nite_28520 [Catellatospora coxensis]